jgi:hypothetical protein
MSVAGAGALRSKMLSGNVDRSIQAYHNMNKFLAAFLEHVRISSSVLGLISKLQKTVHCGEKSRHLLMLPCSNGSVYGGYVCNREIMWTSNCDFESRLLVYFLCVYNEKLQKWTNWLPCLSFFI